MKDDALLGFLVALVVAALLTPLVAGSRAASARSTR